MQFYGFFPAFALEEGLMILIFIKNYLSAVKILLFFKQVLIIRQLALH